MVLHGGGNTSVKTKIKDIDGKYYDVLCVKGSGWDMAEIEPAGLPAVKLNPLKKKKNSLMMTFSKKKFDRYKIAQSIVETFLHAFLPFKFVALILMQL